MSLTQWLTRSTPIDVCTPVMNATRSLVPTPSALATSTGIVPAGVTEPEEPAERPNLGQHSRCEGAARERPNPPNDLVASVDVDAALLVVHGYAEGCLFDSLRAMRKLLKIRACEPMCRPPIRAGDPAGAAQ